MSGLIYNLFFNFFGHCVNVQAKSDELFAEVALRFLQKVGRTGENIKFYFNSNELKLESYKTLAEYGIVDKSKIDIVFFGQVTGGPPKVVGSIITIIFRKGQDILKSQAGSDNLLAGFFGYINNCFNKENLHFFFNSYEIIDKNKTFAYYKINDNSIIDVKDCDPDHCKICCSNLISKIKKENKEIKRQLNKEKDKNKELLKEIDNLKQKLEKMNIKNKKMKELIKQQEELLNNNKQSEYSITSINPGEKILAVNFVSINNQDINHYNLICKNVDLFVSLEERLYKDFPRFKEYDNIYFSVNTRRIKRFKTMDENKIKNNDIISIFINEED